MLSLLLMVLLISSSYSSDLILELLERIQLSSKVLSDDRMVYLKLIWET